MFHPKQNRTAENDRVNFTLFAIGQRSCYYYPMFWSCKGLGTFYIYSFTWGMQMVA